MKKITVLALLVAMVFVCSSCAKTEEDNQPAEAETAAVEQNFDLPKLSDAEGKYPGAVLPESNVYINEQCGYSLTFPEDWKGWYFINDDDSDYVKVRFYGKSLTGTVLEKHAASIDYGLTMFYILTEEEAMSGTYDSTKK